MEDVRLDEMFSADTLRVVNPNIDRPYSMVRNSEEFVARPLKTMKLPKPVGLYFLTKAEKHWADMKQQQKNERLAFLQYEGSTDPKMKDQARKFGKRDEEDKDKIITITQAPIRPWLVNLDHPDGERIYLEAINEAKEKNIPIPGMVDSPLGGEVSTGIDLERPGDGWEDSKLKKYLDENGVWPAPSDKHEQLTRKALRLFDAKVKMFQRMGATVNIIT